MACIGYEASTASKVTVVVADHIVGCEASEATSGVAEASKATCFIMNKRFLSSAAKKASTCIYQASSNPPQYKVHLYDTADYSSTEENLGTKLLTPFTAFRIV